MSPIQCYIKNKDSSTILTPCNRPTTIHKNPPCISFYLPSTPFVCWEWRTRKERATKENQPVFYKKLRK